MKTKLILLIAALILTVPFAGESQTANAENDGEFPVITSAPDSLKLDHFYKNT